MIQEQHLEGEASGEVSGWTQEDLGTRPSCISGLCVALAGNPSTQEAERVVS